MVKFRKYKLNEELGISKDVQNECVELINRINKSLADKSNYRSYHLNNNSEPLVYGVDEILYVLLFDDFPVHVKLQIYFCNGFDDYENIAKQVSTPEDFYFNEKHDTILIRYPIIREKGFDFDANDVQITNSSEDIYGSLSHELKHAYQKAMVVRNTKKEKIFSQRKRNVYTNILNFLHKNNRAGNPDLWDLIYEIYYLYPQELTANIESLYTMTLRNADNIKDALAYVANSKMFKYIEYMSYQLDSIKNGNFDENIEYQVQETLNKGMRWIIAHMDKGLKFAHKKFRQLEKLLRKKYAEFQNK